MAHFKSNKNKYLKKRLNKYASLNKGWWCKMNAGQEAVVLKGLKIL